MTEDTIIAILRAAEETDPVSTPEPSAFRTIAREAIAESERREVDRWVLEHGGRLDYPALPADPIVDVADLHDADNRGPSFYAIPTTALR